MSCQLVSCQLVVSVIAGFVVLGGLSARADVLAPGMSMPDLSFIHVVDGEPAGEATFAEVAKRKSILFVFASW